MDNPHQEVKMAPSTLEPQEQSNSRNISENDIDSLMNQHRSLDENVTNLVNKSYLTPEEDLELHRLKKEKLRLKDKIEAVTHSRKSA